MPTEILVLQPSDIPPLTSLRLALVIRSEVGSSRTRVLVVDELLISESVAYLAVTLQMRVAYDAFVTAAEWEAGPQMTAAWKIKPVKKDKDVPLHTSPLPRTTTDAARARLLAVLQADLDR
jgi:hypothetical protein